MTTKQLDGSVNIVLADPDIDTIRRARRYLRGAAMILADAANGHEATELIAREAATLAVIADGVIMELSVNSGLKEDVDRSTQVSV